MMEVLVLRMTPERRRGVLERAEMLKERRLEMESVIKDGTVGNALNLLELTSGFLDSRDSLLTLAIRNGRNDIVEAMLDTVKGRALIREHGCVYIAAASGNAAALELLADIPQCREQFGPSKQMLDGMQVLPINQAYLYVTALTAAIRSGHEKSTDCIKAILRTQEGRESLKTSPHSYEVYPLDPLSAAAASAAPDKMMKLLLQNQLGATRYKMTFKQAVAALNILGEKSEKEPNATKYLEAASVILSQFDKAKFLTYKSDFEGRGLHSKAAQMWVEEHSKQKEALSKELTKEFVELATTKNLTAEQLESTQINSLIGFIGRDHNNPPLNREVGVVDKFKAFKKDQKSVSHFHELKLTVLDKVYGIFSGKTEKEIKYNKIAKDAIDELMSSPKGKQMLASRVSEGLQRGQSR